MTPGINLLISLFASIAVCLWVYGDAQQRRLKEALVWAVIGLLFSLVGLIIYWLWVIRPNRRGPAS